MIRQWTVLLKTQLPPMAPDIMADMVNSNCVHISCLDALRPVLLLVLLGAYT